MAYAPKTDLEEIAAIRAKIKALEQEEEHRANRVKQYMETEQLDGVDSEHARAVRTSRRSVKVLNGELLLARLTRRQVARMLGADTAFVEAAEHAGVDLDGIVEVTVSESVKIEVHRDAKTREFQRVAMERSKEEFDKKVGEWVQELKVEGAPAEEGMDDGPELPPAPRKKKAEAAPKKGKKAKKGKKK